MECTGSQIGKYYLKKNCFYNQGKCCASGSDVLEMYRYQMSQITTVGTVFLENLPLKARNSRTM